MIDTSKQPMPLSHWIFDLDHVQSLYLIFERFILFPKLDLALRCFSSLTLAAYVLIDFLPLNLTFDHFLSNQPKPAKARQNPLA